MVTIRTYQHADYAMVRAWWLSQDEPAPEADWIGPENTFIAEADGVPALCQSILLPGNANLLAYLEGFVTNPEVSKEARHEAGKEMLLYLEALARFRGYKKLITLSYRPHVAKRIQALGFRPTLTNVTTFVKEL